MSVGGSQCHTGMQQKWKKKMKILVSQKIQRKQSPLKVRSNSISCL